MSSEGIWILAEQFAGRVLPVSFELLRRGRELADKRGAQLSAMVFGHDIDAAGLQELVDRGADRVVATEAPQLEHFLVQPYAACMLTLLDEYRPEIVIAAATTTGRTLMPYVAAKAYVGLTADCTVLDIDPETGGLLQTRPAIGGNILATITTPDRRPQMATVRPHSTRPAEPTPGRTGEIIRRSAPADCPAGGAEFLEFIPETSEHHLEDADFVVAVGRGIKKSENIPVAEDLADALDAALGASREVVDRGWLSYPHQVGLSGKTITPRLYVALGVSGSIQHLAGMQTAETIVAVNSDPEAQIFRVADVGIVGDLFEVAPVLAQRLREIQNGKSEIRNPKFETNTKHEIRNTKQTRDSKS